MILIIIICFRLHHGFANGDTEVTGTSNCFLSSPKLNLLESDFSMVAAGSPGGRPITVLGALIG